MRFLPHIFLLTLALTGLSACAPPAESVAPFALTPYATATLAPAATVRLFPPTETANQPLPSPTPLAHVVAAGETLSALAARYGLTVDEILAANPGLQPQALPIGQTILLPAQSALGQQALPTPVPLPVGEAHCYRQMDGLWCLALVANPSSDVIGLLTGQMILLDPAGSLLASEPALALLDNLPPRATLPLVAFFRSAPSGQLTARLQIATALRLPPNAAPVFLQVRNLFSRVELSGRTASLTGNLFLPLNMPAASQIWLAALGYDQSGQLVAFRRVELISALAPGESLPFALDLFSLGPALWRVEVYAEAH